MATGLRSIFASRSFARAPIARQAIVVAAAIARRAEADTTAVEAVDITAVVVVRTAEVVGTAAKERMF